MSEFIAACGHKADIKQLGQICPECFLNTHAELATFRSETERLREAARLAKKRLGLIEHRTHQHCPHICAHCAADDLIDAVLDPGYLPPETPEP